MKLDAHDSAGEQNLTRTNFNMRAVFDGAFRFQ